VVNTNVPSRQARLKAWFLLNNIEQKDLAKKMGISQQLLSMTLTGSRATRERIGQLISYGVPEDLLPVVRDKKKTGPKVNSKAQFIK